MPEQPKPKPALPPAPKAGNPTQGAPALFPFGPAGGPRTSNPAVPKPGGAPPSSGSNQAMPQIPLQPPPSGLFQQVPAANANPQPFGPPSPPGSSQVARPPFGTAPGALPPGPPPPSNLGSQRRSGEAPPWRAAPTAGDSAMYMPPVEFVQEAPNHATRNMIIVLVGFVAIGAFLLVVGPRLMGGGARPWEPSPNAEQWAPTSKNDFKYALYTIDLMYMAENACIPYMLFQKDQMPMSVEEMIRRGMVESRVGWDAWGSPMTFDGVSWRMSSPGKDEKWGTPDDISHVFDQAPEIPKVYWADGGMEGKAQQALMGDHVNQWQTTNEMKRNGLLSDPAGSRDSLGLAPRDTGAPKDEFQAVGSGSGSYNVDEGESDSPTFDSSGNMIGDDSSEEEVSDDSGSEEYSEE